MESVGSMGIKRVYITTGRIINIAIAGIFIDTRYTDLTSSLNA